jgi:hypothetical protein
MEIASTSIVHYRPGSLDRHSVLYGRPGLELSRSSHDQEPRPDTLARREQFVLDRRNVRQ